MHENSMQFDRFNSSLDIIGHLDLVVILRNQHGVDAVSFLRSMGSGEEVVSGGRDGKLYTYEVVRPLPKAETRGPDSLESEKASLLPVGIHIEKHVAAIEGLVDLDDVLRGALRAACPCLALRHWRDNTSSANTPNTTIVSDRASAIICRLPRRHNIKRNASSFPMSCNAASASPLGGTALHSRRPGRRRRRS